MSAQVYNIPLEVGTPQTFSATIGLIEYRFTLRYLNVQDGGWVIDIADSSGNALISGMPMVTGCNLLEQYGHLGFGGALYVQTTSDPDAAPSFSNLGSDGLLYWVPSQ